MNDIRARGNWALHIACEYGQDKVVAYLHNAFNLTATDVRSKRNFALRLACKNGHVVVIRYLHSRFNLNIDDARTNNNYALRGACANGHLATINYLREVFYLTKVDALERNCEALRVTCDKIANPCICRIKNPWLEGERAEYCTCMADDEIRVNKELEVVKCLRKLFDIGIIDYIRYEYGMNIDNEQEALNWLKINIPPSLKAIISAFEINNNDY